MGIWGIVITVIVAMAVIGLVMRLYEKIRFEGALDFIPTIYSALNKALDFVTYPLRVLTDWLVDLFYRLKIVRTISGYQAMWDYKLDRFGGVVPVIMSLVSIVFTIIASIFILIFTDDTALDIFRRALLNTTIGTACALLEEGLSFSPTTLITASFAGLLAHLCMSKASAVKWYIWIPYCIIFVFATAILTSFMEGALESTGKWIYNTIIGLWESDKSTIFLVILKLIPLVILAYLTIISLVIVVREYFCAILFGVATLIVLLVLGLGSQYLGVDSSWSGALVSIVFLIGVVGTEKVRDILDEKLEDF